MVLIEPESCDYFVGQTTVEAYQKAKRKYPNKIFFSDGKEGLVGIEFLRGKRFVLDLKKLAVSLEQ